MMNKVFHHFPDRLSLKKMNAKS